MNDDDLDYSLNLKLMTYSSYSFTIVLWRYYSTYIAGNIDKLYYIFVVYIILLILENICVHKYEN